MDQFGGIVTSGMNTLGQELQNNIANPLTNGILGITSSISTLSQEMAALSASFLATSTSKKPSTSLLQELEPLMIYGGVGLVAIMMIKKLKHH